MIFFFHIFFSLPYILLLIDFNNDFNKENYNIDNLEITDLYTISSNILFEDTKLSNYEKFIVEVKKFNKENRFII